MNEFDEVENAAPHDTLPSYPSGIRFVLLTLGLIFTVFLSALDSSILSTAIPAITDEFGTVKDVGWYGAAYTITNAAFISTWGKAVRR
jgi:MFS transporter, DHA2 family, glioxin efflux transporter